MLIQRAEAEQRYLAALETTSESDDSIAIFLAWAADPALQFDPDAEQFLSEVYRSIAQATWDSVRNDPSHRHFRIARRHLATVTGEHSTAVAQLRGLEAAPALEDMTACKESVSAFVLEVVQFIRDVCFDESQLSQRSQVQLEDMAVALGCVDELMAGLALYRHNYMSQAGAHARTVLETVELLELFEAKPEIRADWRSKEPGVVPKQGLRPWEIREATGKDRRNVFYDLLCDVSSHPRNLWASSRISLSGTDDADAGLVCAAVTAAGTRDPMLTAVVSVALVFVATLIALRLTLTSLSEAGTPSNVQYAADSSDKSVGILEDCLGSSGDSISGVSEILLELRSGLAGISSRVQADVSDPDDDRPGA